MNRIDAACRRLLFERLATLTAGELQVQDTQGLTRFGPGGDLSARIEILDPRCYRALVLGGHLAAAETWMDGWWRTGDLTAVVRLLVRNREVLEGLERGPARLLAPVRWLAHALQRNTRGGSRRNIAAHYDLGNEFFALFLDETLTYSCGIFEHPEATMREASVAKYDRLCRAVGLGPEHHVLEIGTGWGGFALHAAGTYGCRVTTTTISAEQHAEATRRVAAAGLADRITVLRQDYRDVQGSYDRIVSIEMIEAVGHQYYPVFFRRCAELLRPDGAMGLQAITIQDRLFNEARRHVDVIKRYIFPGSCIPSVTALCQAAAGASDLRLLDLHDITPHYAETLRRWRQAFTAQWERIGALGFSTEFRRLWEFYFCYCEGGFMERQIGDVQMVFARPGFPAARQ